MELTRIQKIAVLIMVIGEELASSVFKHLSSQEIQQISMALLSLPQIPNDQLVKILSECQDEIDQFSALSFNIDEYLHSILVKALGEAQAENVLSDILEQKGGRFTGIEMLNFMEPQIAADLIGSEHPQIIATILIHLSRMQAADILGLLDEPLRNDVVLRIAKFGGLQPIALQELTESLNSLLDGQTIKQTKIGGVRTAAEIINFVKSEQEEAIIESIRNRDGGLAQKIIEEMFLFENLVTIDDGSIQRLLKEIETESLVIALKGANDELRNKFLSNMPQRSAEILRDDLESRGPVRLSQVDAEQKSILLIARRLADAGEIILTSGDDKYV